MTLPFRSLPMRYQPLSFRDLLVSTLPLVLVFVQLTSHQLQPELTRSRLSILPSPLRSYTPPPARPYFPPLPCAASGAEIAANATMPSKRLIRLIYPSGLS